MHSVLYKNSHYQTISYKNALFCFVINAYYVHLGEMSEVKEVYNSAVIFFPSLLSCV